MNISIIQTTYEFGYNVTKFGSKNDNKTLSLKEKIEQAVGRPADQSHKNGINNYLVSWVGIDKFIVDKLLLDETVEPFLFLDDSRVKNNEGFTPNPSDTKYMNDDEDISFPETPDRQQ